MLSSRPLLFILMATFTGKMLGNEDSADLSQSGQKLPSSTKALFSKKNPGAPGKLGRTSSIADSLQAKRKRSIEIIMASKKEKMGKKESEGKKDGMKKEFGKSKDCKK